MSDHQQGGFTSHLCRLILQATTSEEVVEIVRKADGVVTEQEDWVRIVDTIHSWRNSQEDV